MPRLDVHLNGWQQELRRWQFGVAGVARGDKVLLGDPFVHVNIVDALVRYCSGPTIFLPARGFVVLSKMDDGLIRKSQQALDGVVQGLGAATGEIGAGGAVVRHKQGVTDK